MFSNHESEIVLALQRDLQTGFPLLLKWYKEPIYWHIRRLVVSHDDAQDATQETFVRVFRSFANFRGESKFSSWLYRIATNEALRVISRRRSDMADLDDPNIGLDLLLTEEYVDYSDLEAVKLQRAIHSLPTKQQLAFNLRYYDELDYAEIAQILNSSASSAKTNYHLAKEKIIRFLKTND